MLNPDRIFTVYLLALCAFVSWLVLRLMRHWWLRRSERRANGRRLRTMEREA